MNSCASVRSWMVRVAGVSALLFGAALIAPDARALQLTVAWDNTSSGATGFKIERSSDGISFAEIAAVAAASTTYVDGNLTAGSYSYRVRAFNDSNVSGYSNVAVYSTDSVPAITTQPVAVTVVVGGGATFTVAASGSPSPTFQWLKNAAPIAGANASTFSIPATAFSDAATYSVIVSNRAGSITSNGAVLTVSGIAPAITTQPVSQTVAAGSTVSFTVAASGTPAPAFQWTKNGANITGATGATFAIAGVSGTDAGNYAVVATNTAGKVTSQAASLTVSTPSSATAPGSTTSPSDSTISPSSGRLANISARAIPAQGAASMSVNFTIAGGSKTVLVRGVGPALDPMISAPTMADPKIGVSMNGTAVASNDNWGGSAALVTLFNQVGAFPLAANSKDAALTSTLAASNYAATFNGKLGGIAMLELYDADAVAGAARFSKVVARAPVGTGEGQLIAGFTITGNSAVRMLIRAVGPSLSGVKGVLADPQLSVFSAGTLVAKNDNWGGTSALNALFTQVGASSFANQSKDSAVDVTLQPGTYSATISGVNNATGIAVLEFYEVQ